MSLSKSQIAFLLNVSESTYLKYIILKYKKKRLPTQQIYKDRFVFGEFHHLYKNLCSDAALFLTYTRMSIETFDYIVEKITPDCSHVTTNFQKPISVEERLIVTIR